MNYYCKYCGRKYSSIQNLTSNFCHKNPDGKYHVLYEGDEKSTYYCKYCGRKYSSIQDLTSNFCHNNPDGKYHAPAR